MQLPSTNPPDSPSTPTSPPPPPSSTTWPQTPFHTRGIRIFNAANQPIHLAGVNWPGHGKPMIPEGLQHASIRSIVNQIKSLGMNVVRLTWATEMVDDIITRGDDVGIRESFVRALGKGKGLEMFERVVRWNPELEGVDGKGVTRLEVFDAVAEELARQEIYVHLDNHISSAGWCCGAHDGNGWFGDVHFPVGPWLRGLAYMAQHARKWRSFISMSLRNEPRDTPANLVIHRTYNWSTWYDNMIPALQTVHAANPDPLIFLSGIDYDTTLAPITIAADISGPSPGPKRFDLSDFPTFRDKIVFELHTYRLDVKWSFFFKRDLIKAGYNAMVPPLTDDNNSTTTTITNMLTSKPKDKVNNIAPVVLTEFGFPQDHSAYKSVYAQTLKDFLTEIRGGWMYWVLAGSYYEREGQVEFDEGWGLLDREWRAWRDERAVREYFRPLVGGVLRGEGKG